MNLREKMNEKPGAVAGGVAIVVIIAVLLVVQTTRGSLGFGPKPGGGAVGLPSEQLYFTVDDGKTYFPDDAGRIPPFTTAEGKTAYRAVVAKSATGAPFVAHLEKYADNDKKQLEEALAAPGARQTMLSEINSNALSMALVKKPLTGDKGWLSRAKSPAQYDVIATLKVPGGSAAQQVFP